ncbi:MAG: rhomboid family intramembrane serine protease [Candidatus Omnitrophica bacterium]|nr:rhomboid family intramembrane serine protease [Candidatus Omnitrophota bacterium]MCM8798728.1 rhomboid family intramembrane serine protease [Candidatus Omnitrophota bacterium]
MIPLRDENPTQSFSFITFSLIVINSFIFFYGIFLAERLAITLLSFTLIPYNFVNYFDFSQFTTLFTSQFLHGNLLHLLGNMLYLWIFGNNIEDVLGHLRFLFFYLLCGVFSSLVHIFTHPQSTIPTLGASGAISGVLGAYFLLFPRAKILALLPFFPFFRMVKIPAFFFLGIWAFWQFLLAISSPGGETVLDEGVAWFAHLGGFLAGILLLPFFSRGRRRKQI